MGENGPLTLHRETVHSDWIDYNGHMNLAYYVLVFDHGTDALLDHVGLDAAYRERAGGSVFVVESHVTYNAEVMLGDDMRIASRVLDVDAKRLRLYHEMWVGDGDIPAATNELMILHVDLKSRRTAPFPGPAFRALTGIWEQHRVLAQPSQVGRGISFQRNAFK